jgi:hypothetical protein
MLLQVHQITQVIALNPTKSNFFALTLVMPVSQFPSMWVVDPEGINPVAIWTMFQMFSHDSNKKSDV